MPDIIQELIKILLAIAPYVTLLLLSYKINLSKQKRSRQFIFPLVAVVYCIIAIFTTNKVNNIIISFIALLGQYVPFIYNLNLTEWLNYIFNSIIVIVFLIVKGIFLPIADKIWSKEHLLFNQTSGKFYEHNERMSAWVLKDEFGQAKTLWKGFYWFGVGISSVILALARLYPEWIFFQTPFYPVFGVLVMGEILFFLSGLTLQEMLSTIAGDNDEHYRIANYGILRRVFHEFYEDRILFDNTADNLSGITSFEMLDNLAESDNKLDKVISKYFTDLKEKGYNIDPSFVRSSIDMVNGKSVLINIPFYQDLTAYILLPLVRKLLSYEKALVIVGRDSAADDVKNWMNTGIASFCGTPYLWKTEIMTEQESDWDIAILRFADVYNRRIFDINAKVLNQVGFVLLIEPSRIASTGQIGLSLIVDKISKDSKEVVYCSCDRNCDGLVDTISHIFKVNLTEVFATIPTLATSSFMYWNAHGDFMHHKILSNIAHYLGIGTELSTVALRNQISNTNWISSECFPVLDIKWIAGQYYNSICNYIGYQQSQEAFADVFKVDSNLWNLKIQDNSYLTVEDEFNNLFEMTRLYSTRAKNQGFVNVVSENYLLRDYMVEYASIFSADSKVIPSIVSDYTRTERNTVVGMIMRMYCGEVSKTELEHHLSLAGIKYTDAFDKFCELVPEHCNLDIVEVTPFFKEETVGDEMLIVKCPYYTIQDSNTKLAVYARNLSNAYFIIEDDKDKNYFLGDMLYGQVFQKFLPGQFLTYSGKYYQVHTIMLKNGAGVVLRRASDHITDRKCYRQRREYTLSNFKKDHAMGSSHTSRGIEICRGFYVINVKTHGYYELTSLDNLAAAHLVDLNGIPERDYRNKAVLCLKLPGVNEDVRFTIALLLNEIFITFYPESYHYITATIKKNSDTVSNITDLLNIINLNGIDDEDSIFIIEDCEIDLGLLVSIERNITRFLEIISECLIWNEMKLTKAGYFEKKDEEADCSEIIKETPEESVASETDIEQEGTEENNEKNTEDNENDDIAVDEQIINTQISGAELIEPPKKYSDSFYLLYGYKKLDFMLNIKDTLRFLSLNCYDKNALEQARINSDIAASIKAEYLYFKKPDAHFCDFCAVELSGAEYDTLSDGRERCVQCSKSPLKTVEQFTRLYENALRNMETFFGIRINVPIKVRMANAKKIAKLCGLRFVPSPRYIGRVLAFAKKDSNGYTIYVENGSPKIAAVANIVHELTHIWQYVNWNNVKILKHYGKENRLLIYEGMAKWVEIQYLFFLNEVSYAKRQEIYTRWRDDDYGRGFIKYADQYPLIYGPGYRKTSPFNKELPLELPI